MHPKSQEGVVMKIPNIVRYALLHAVYLFAILDLQLPVNQSVSIAHFQKDRYVLKDNAGPYKRCDLAII